MSTKKQKLAAVAVITVVALVSGLVLMQQGRLLGRSKTLSDPSQCHTALLRTTSCRGEDTSFQECHYYFRAEGEPRANVCRAFLETPELAKNSGTGNHECKEQVPSEWKRVSCSDFALPADFACFSCSRQEHEASTKIVQAFTQACDRAIVLKGCNVDIAKLPVVHSTSAQ